MSANKIEIPNCPENCQAFHNLNRVMAIMDMSRAQLYELMSEFDAGRIGLRYTFKNPVPESKDKPTRGQRLVKHEWINQYFAAVDRTITRLENTSMDLYGLNRNRS